MSITYEDAMNIGNEFFDEYLPKVSAPTRQALLAGLFAELADAGCLDVDDPEPDPDYEESDF